MSLKIETIDKGNCFDFGKTSAEYAMYRDIYPKSLYQKLTTFGIGNEEQKILDLGTGTGVIPRNMNSHNVKFTATDISENQIKEAEKLSVGMDIEYKVCSAENTGFDINSFDVVIACQCFHYFNLDRFVPELVKILKPQGKFCKIFMDWLPYEDEIVNEMEQLVLEYNPHWTGGGFKQFNYSFPLWAKEQFEIDTIHSYNENLHFTKDSWRGRIRTCRGLGASLTENEVNNFDSEYKSLLNKYNTNYLNIRHQIHVEIYRLKLDAK